MIKRLAKREGFVVYQFERAECEKLFLSIKEASLHYYPQDKLGASAALMTESGQIYQGVSYFSNTHTLTMHAEASALTHAAIHGETKIVAVSGPNCHICKQLIYESSMRSKIDTVIVMREGDKFVQVPISEMMPYPWPEPESQF